MITRSTVFGSLLLLAASGVGADTVSLRARLDQAQETGPVETAAGAAGTASMTYDTASLKTLDDLNDLAVEPQSGQQAELLED